MLCLWLQEEQSVDVRFGDTLTYGIPAFQALCSSIRSRALHLCSDIFFENLLDRSIPETPGSSAPILTIPYAPIYSEDTGNHDKEFTE